MTERRSCWYSLESSGDRQRDNDPLAYMLCSGSHAANPALREFHVLLYSFELFAWGDAGLWGRWITQWHVMVEVAENFSL